MPAFTARDTVGGPLRRAPLGSYGSGSPGVCVCLRGTEAEVCDDATLSAVRQAAGLDCFSGKGDPAALAALNGLARLSVVATRVKPAHERPQGCRSAASGGAQARSFPCPSIFPVSRAKGSGLGLTGRKPLSSSAYPSKFLLCQAQTPHAPHLSLRLPAANTAAGGRQGRCTRVYKC